MSRLDQSVDHELEGIVRDALHQTIVPPPTPERVIGRVERIAADAMGSRRRRLAWPRALGPAVAVGAVAVVATAALLWSRPPELPASGSPTAGVNSYSPGSISVVGLVPNGGAIVYVDGEGLRVTTDYGATWSEPRQIPASYSVQDHIWDSGTLDFVDSQHGWMTSVHNGNGGSQVVEYRTEDGGETWQSSPVTTSPPDESAPDWFVGAQQHFWDALHGRLIIDRVFEDGSVGACQAWDTDDAGKTWSGPKEAPCVGLFPQAHWETDTLGYANALASRAAVYVTTDGGRIWHEGNLPGTWATAEPELLIEDGAGGLTLVVAEMSYSAPPPVRVLHSSDGGTSWSTQYAVTLSSGATSIDEISALAPEHWIAIVEDAVVPPCPSGATACTFPSVNRLIETRDGGRTWSSLADTPLHGAGGMRWWDDKRGLVLADPPACVSQNGVNCDSGKALYVTNDGGKTWHPTPF